MTQYAIPFMQIRGGSSKGLYFKAEDLPSDELTRNKVLLAALGSDARQIDGLGGADPLTSKAAIVSASSLPGVDVDFLFAQVVVGENTVDTRPNCGNILSGVGAFAIESGLVNLKSPETRIIVHMVNSGKNCELILQTPDGRAFYSGETKIDGVPGSSAPIVCNYAELAGSACGVLLPTGNATDIIDDIQITCIDNGMPVAIIKADSMGINGDESPEELNANTSLYDKIQSLRLQLGLMMNLGDVKNLAVPKMCMVSPAKFGGTISTRTFIPHKCHAAIGVLGAVSVASACMLPGSVCHNMAKIPGGDNVALSIEHPSGEFSVQLEVARSESQVTIKKAGVIRTARLLSRGELYIPLDVYSGPRERT